MLAAVFIPASAVTLPPKAPPGPVAAALTAMVQELDAATPAGMPLQQGLDKLLQFRHSPATAALLRTIYGSTPAWTLRRLPAGAGSAKYRAELAPLRFVDADGSSVTWAAFPLDLAVRGEACTFSGAWPHFASSDQSVRIALRALTLAGQQRRSADHLWFGSNSVDVASVTMAGATGGARLALDGIHLEAGSREQPGGVELDYRLAVRKIAVGMDAMNGKSGDDDIGIDDVIVRSRFTSLERATLLELQAWRQLTVAAGTARERQVDAARLIKTLARGVIRSGSAIELDELSASFHGQRLRASGRISLEGALAADADDLPALFKKLAVQLTIRAPRALLTEVAKVMATAQLRAKQAGVATPQAVAQLAASLDDMMLAKLIAGGLVRIDGDLLASDIDYSAARGGLRVNGKAPPLPAMPGSARPAAAVAGAAPSLLQARRIDGRCALPDYPADIVNADAPLALTLRLVAKADGSVANLMVAMPSTRPDYDRAVLAAAARCVYLPALRDGVPVDAPVAWKIVRESGSTHP